MKPVVLFILAGLVVLGAMLTAAYTIDRTSPGVDAARARQAAAEASEAETRANLAARQAAIDAAEYPRRAGAVTVAVVLALVGIGAGGCIALAGIGIALARAANLRAQLISAQTSTGLYPAIVLQGQPTTFNERGAQLISAMPRRPTAALMSRILAPPVEAPAQVAALPAPSPILLPDRVELSAWHPGNDLALPVGIGPNGRAIDIPLRGDLALITAAGLPGSGKTSLLRSFAHSIATQSPWGDRCKAVIIDPKRVEFSQLATTTPWLWRPVCRDHDTTGRALHDLVNELDDRFKLMERARQATYQGMGWPAVVVLVDELAILSKDRAIMGDLTRLATLGRAAGVVIVAATQRPSAIVLTPELRALADVSVSFRVRSANESRLTLADYTGAELLPADKPGRAIYKRDDLTPVQTYLAPAFAMPPPPRFKVVDHDDQVSQDVDQVEQDHDDQVEHIGAETQRDDAVWIAQARQMAAAGASRRKIELTIFGYAGGAATRRVEAALQGTQAE